MVDRDSAPAEEMSPGYPTEALLRHQDAAAQELRADLDQLRRQLDDGPPPLPPSRRRSRRPLFGFLIAGGVITAFVAAILIPWSDLDRNPAPPIASPAEPGSPSATPSDSAEPAASAAPSASAAASGSAGASGSTSASSSAVPSASAASDPAASTPASRPAPAPRPAPVGSMPGSGPGVDAPGTMLLVQVTKDGSLNVIEQARFGSSDVPEIDLRLPSLTSLGGKVAELSPTAQDVRVAVNGTPALANPTADGLGWAVARTGRARTVQLSYRIGGAVVRTQPSSSGRALGVSLPLLGQTLREQGLPLVVRAEGINGATVGGATCPSAPTTKMLCGEEISDGWQATIPAEATSPVVLLQLTLG